jgi:mitogen-activated protein kinase 1/3
MESSSHTSTKQCKAHYFNTELFYLPIRYEPVLPLGNGAYGSVISCNDLLYNRKVAIKKLVRISDSVDVKRALREIMIMKYSDHENIIKLYDVIFHIHNPTQFGDVYLVMEHMDSDLQKIIQSNQPLSDEHNQFILYQILRALKYLHSAKVIHRDLKPSNVLINSDVTIKLCDFGMSRNLSDNDKQLTEYVVTRYYRAPEIMLSSHHYSEKIDVWSVGCTFGELLKKKFLFPGEHYMAQIKLIIETLGSPSEEEQAFIPEGNAKDFVNSNSLKNIPKKNIAEVVNYNENPHALDLLDKMLQFNPNKRISINDAISHEYLMEMTQNIEDPVFVGKLNMFFENNDKLTQRDLYNLFIQEISSFESGVVY